MRFHSSRTPITYKNIGQTETACPNVEALQLRI
jgi:hypothetical protein